MNNCTAVSEFLILGFHTLQDFKMPLFILFLIIYIVSCLENLLIIVLVISSTRLQTPMYIILNSMSSCEFLYITNLVPKMLHDMLSERAVITVIGCITQLQIYATIGNAMSFHYALMSYDRYLAISNPLRYSTLINNRFCLHLVIAFWLIALTLSSVSSVFLCQLEFCCYNIIHHFHCDFSPLVEISCSDTKPVQFVAALISGIVILLPFLFTIFSYIFIIYTILGIPSSRGRKKAFSTCSSHLLVVAIHFGILISVYVLPTRENGSYNNKGFSFMYIMVTPLINPIIYTLRNQEFHRALETKVNQMKYFMYS